MKKESLHTMMLLYALMTITCLKVLMFCCDAQASGQLMRFQVTVDHEFAITRFRAPNWGLIPVDSGQVYLPAENENAGRFTISATENVHVLLTMETPSELVLNPDNTIEFDMYASYVQDGQTDARLANPILGNYAIFSLSTGNLIPASSLLGKLHELRANVFFYGVLNVGDVEPGVYSGEVTVRVEYL